MVKNSANSTERVQVGGQDLQLEHWDEYDQIDFIDAAFPELTSSVSRDHREDFWRLELATPRSLESTTSSAIEHNAAARIALRAALALLELNGAALAAR